MFKAILREVMSGIRVLLGHMPPLLRSVIGDMLLTAPGIELVAADTEPQGLGHILATGNVDVVILRRPALEAWPDVLAGLAAAAPIGVITIEPDGRVGALYHLRRAALDFQTNPRTGLLDAVRAAAAS